MTVKSLLLGIHLNRAQALLFAPAALFFAESAIFIIRPFSISPTLAHGMYPQAGTLESYCRIHECLYPSLQVASLYSVQLATLCVLATAVMFRSLTKKTFERNFKLRTFCGLIILSVIVDYISGNFSFHPTWLLPNSVTESSLGVFRYSILFWFATTALIVLSDVYSSMGVNDRSH